MNVFFAFFEFVLFSILFFLVIKNKRTRDIILSISAFNLLFLIFIVLFFKSKFDFCSTLSNTLIIFVYSIIFFYSEINSPRTLIIYQSSQFWIVLGCVIFYSGTLFVFLYTSDMKDKMLNSLWNSINLTFEIAKNICFSIAFIVARKNTQNILASDFDDTNMLEKPF